MLRLAPALLFLLAGCAGLTGDDGSVRVGHDTGSPAPPAPEPVPPSVPIIALLSEHPESLTVVVEVPQMDGKTPPRQVYQAIRQSPVTTPPASMDPPCGAAPKELKVSAVSAISGQTLDTVRVPYACGPEWFVVLINEDGTVTAGTIEALGGKMPSSWKRGDAWPWDESGAGQAPPTLSFSILDDHLRISGVSSDADWHHLSYSGTCSVMVWRNDHGSSARSGEPITDENERVSIGDYLDAQLAEGQKCSITIHHASGKKAWGPYELWQPDDFMPAISWSVSQADASATVTSADPDVDWSDYTVAFLWAGRLTLNNDQTIEVPKQEYVAMPSGAIGGGDVLTFCRHDGPGTMEAALHHVASDQHVRMFDFNEVPACE